MKSKLILVAVLIIAVIGVSVLLRNKPGQERVTATRPGSGDESVTVEGPKSTRIIRSQPSDAASEGRTGSTGSTGSTGPGAASGTPRGPQTGSAAGAKGEAPGSTVATAEAGDRRTTSPEVLQEISDLAAKYGTASDDDKSELIDKLADIEDPAAVQQLLAMLHAESDPDLRAEIFQAIAWNDAKDEVASQVISTFEQLYKNTEDLTERLEIQDALGEFDNVLAANMLRSIFDNPQADPEEKMSAAESLLRMRSREEELLSYEDATRINEQLQLDYQAVTEPHLKTQAIMALAEMRSENKYFFQQMLTTEQNPSVRRLLEQLVTSIARLESKTAGGQQVTTAPL